MSDLDAELEAWQRDGRKRERVARVGYGVLVALVLVVCLVAGVLGSALEWRLNQWLWGGS